MNTSLATYPDRYTPYPPMERDTNRMDGSNVTLSTSTRSDAEMVFDPISKEEAAYNTKNIVSNENTSSSEDYFSLDMQKEHTESQGGYKVNAFDGIKECLDFGDPRSTILKSMCILLGNNLQEIRCCIEKLEKFQSEDIELKKYATLLAQFIQKKYDESFKDFKIFSDEEIAIICKDNLYNEKAAFLKKSINILPRFIYEINKKIDKDGTPVRPSMGVFSQVTEAFFGLSLIMINIATILEPMLSLFCMYFSIIVGFFLFIARINLAIKIFNFDEKGKGSLLPVDGVQEIKNCIPSIEKCSNLGEGALIEKYYQFKKKMLTFFGQIINNQIKIQAKLKNFNVDLGDYQTIVKAEFEEINKKQENTNEDLGKISDNIDLVLNFLKSLYSGMNDSGYSSASSSRPGTPLPPSYMSGHPVGHPFDRSNSISSTGFPSPVLNRVALSADNIPFFETNSTYNNSPFHIPQERKRKCSTNNSPLASYQGLWN